MGATVDFDSFKQALTDMVQRQTPFATALALTKTAQLVKAAEQKEMLDVFDRPTPYTLNSLFVKPATKARLEAYVWLKDARAGPGTPADVYLKPEIQGGQRLSKKFEKALESVGVLPAGFLAVPGSAAKIDQYGNMDRGEIVQILSYFRTFAKAGFSANTTLEKKAKLAKGTKTKQGFAYFVGRAGGRGPLGVWKRLNAGRGRASGLKPILIFINGANYHKVFDFSLVAKKTYDKEFAGQLQSAFNKALSTAR